MNIAALVARIERLERARKARDLSPLVIHFLDDDDRVVGSQELRLQFEEDGHDRD